MKFINGFQLEFITNISTQSVDEKMVSVMFNKDHIIAFKKDFDFEDRNLIKIILGHHGIFYYEGSAESLLKIIETQ